VNVVLSLDAQDQARGHGDLALMAINLLETFHDCGRYTGEGVTMANHPKDRSIPTRLMSNDLGDVWFWWIRKGLPFNRYIEITRFSFTERKGDWR
jgi:hypothetical protein